MFNRLRAQLQASSPILDDRKENKVEPQGQSAAERELEMEQLKAKMQEDMEHQVSLHKSMSEQAMACIKADFERKVHMLPGRGLNSFLLSFTNTSIVLSDYSRLLKFHFHFLKISQRKPNYPSKDWSLYEDIIHE